MEMNDYQKRANQTAIYPDKGHYIIYPILGLVGEAGEVANKYKKFLRGDVSQELVAKQLTDELGDVLWYLSAMATELGLSLDDLATRNLAKLDARKRAGTLKGSGDSR